MVVNLTGDMSHGPFCEMAPPIVQGIPQYIFQIPGISSFLGFPCTFSFMHQLLTGFWQVTLTQAPIFAWSLSLLLYSGWKPLWHRNSYVLHVDKRSTKWMISSSATNSNSSQGILNCGYSNYLAELLSMVKWIWGNRFSRQFFSSGNILKWNIYITLLLIK